MRESSDALPRRRRGLVVRRRDYVFKVYRYTDSLARFVLMSNLYYGRFLVEYFSLFLCR